MSRTPCNAGRNNTSKPTPVTTTQTANPTAKSVIRRRIQFHDRRVTLVRTSGPGAATSGLKYVRSDCEASLLALLSTAAGSETATATATGTGAEIGMAIGGLATGFATGGTAGAAGGGAGFAAG